MKRFHVHVNVADLGSSVRFYSKLFGADPTVTKDDYAKWMLEDPRVNFAISSGAGREFGVNHLGFQVDSSGELLALQRQLQEADAGVVEQQNTACCYARSDKYWVTDPSGVAWESFHTLGSAPVYGSTDRAPTGEPCCVPEAASAGKCCAPNPLAAEPCCVPAR